MISISKNIIIIILVAVIIVLGSFLVFSNIQKTSSNTVRNNSGPQPRISVSEEEWDFGKVIQGEKPTHVFVVKNEGKGDLIIEGIKESCTCIEISTDINLIKPGESAELNVSYDTNDYVG